MQDTQVSDQLLQFPGLIFIDPVKAFYFDNEENAVKESPAVDIRGIPTTLAKTQVFGLDDQLARIFSHENGNLASFNFKDGNFTLDQLFSNLHFEGLDLMVFRDVNLSLVERP